MKAVVLLSGGLDSTVCMAVAKEHGYELYPISFRYGQRHSRELECAQKIAKHFGVARHLIIDTNMNAIGGSALTDDAIQVPKGDVERDTIQVTYVPARNLKLLRNALGYAEVVGAEKIFIGVNSVDYSGYPDCRPKFIELFQQVADYATKTAVTHKSHIEVAVPLLNLTKKDIVLLGTKLGAPLEMTTSCYNGGEEACGVCDSCLLRLKGFKEAGLKDPIKYRTRSEA